MTRPEHPLSRAERRVREREERVARQAAIAEKLGETGHEWAAEAARVVLAASEQNLELARNGLRAVRAGERRTSPDFRLGTTAAPSRSTSPPTGLRCRIRLPFDGSQRGAGRTEPANIGAAGNGPAGADAPWRPGVDGRHGACWMSPARR